MIRSRFVVSSPDREKALTYLLDCLKGSLLMQQLGTVFPEQGNLTLVSSSTPPVGVDYFTDWSKISCRDWLVDTISDYIKLGPNSIVLFEDLVSSPSDPYLSRNQHPPYWCFQGRIFWPITAESIIQHSVAQVMAWSAGMRTIAGFLTLPDNCSLAIETHLLSPVEFQQIASSVTQMATDVFDGGGYLVWKGDSTNCSRSLPLSNLPAN